MVVWKYINVWSANGDGGVESNDEMTNILNYLKKLQICVLQLI